MFGRTKHRNWFSEKRFPRQPNSGKHFPFLEISISGKYVFSGNCFTATKRTLRPTVKPYISREKKKKTLLVKIRSWPVEKNLSWYNMVNHITQFINRCYWPLQPSYYRLLKPCIFFETTLIQTVIQSPTPRKKKKPPMRPVWVNDWNDQKTSPNKKRIKQW